ncbi:unnamed protein product [Oppiella nova]|uniref:Peptidase S1 domain-containing protein n=1 Tax=Oppiella nova TaxID=334625 RepID=A0A7R9QU82_9ACAR|nr:unnamed protein product [Oppiella nova]CAG2174220.1 unnamed protein product [Oppiella nova]
MLRLFVLTLITSTMCLSLVDRDVSHETMDSNAQIIRGHDAKAGDNPHMCSLRWDGIHDCGASIIGDQWVVTAAHCVLIWDTYHIKNGTASLHCGTIARSTSGSNYNVSKIIYHELYDQPPGLHDIALVKIVGKFELGSKNLNKIEMAANDTDVAPGSIVRSIGWGMTNENITTLPEILQTLDVPVVKRSDCQSIYIDFYNYTVAETSICAGGEGRDVCGHDSGSPLTHNNIFVGITSWGKACAHVGYPTGQSGTTAVPNLFGEYHHYYGYDQDIAYAEPVHYETQRTGCTDKKEPGGSMGQSGTTAVPNLFGEYHHYYGYDQDIAYAEPVHYETQRTGCTDKKEPGGSMVILVDIVLALKGLLCPIGPHTDQPIKGCAHVSKHWTSRY